MPKHSPLKSRRYQFTLDGRRRNVSLGQLPDYLFAEYAKHLDDLVIAKRLATLPTESTSRWLADIADGLHAKIAAAGLCEGRGDTLLGTLLDAYVEQNGGGKQQGTLDRWRDDVNRLLEFFGAERNIKSVRQYDCEGYKQHLYNVKEYAHSTIGKALRNAKQFFAWFVRRGVILQNPFAEVKGSDATIEERTQYVPSETVETVIEYCHDAEWRAIFALARYAGLRPGEIQILKLDDIKWERNRIIVKSPKTKHHVGGGQRETPIFPELRPYLLEVCEQADVGAVYVLERLRQRSAGAERGKKINLGKILCDILDKAGIQKWGKPFVSLRSSCETDLAEITHCTLLPLGLATRHALRKSTTSRYCQNILRKRQRLVLGSQKRSQKLVQIPVQPVQKTVQQEKKRGTPETMKKSRHWKTRHLRQCRARQNKEKTT